MNFESFCRQFDVPRETFDRLSNYVDTLLKWQNKINLISPTTIPDIWSRHILDSVQFSRHIPNHDARIVDLGSGAGLPGLILSIMGYSDVHLVESDQRKCIFLQEAARISLSNPLIHNERIEKLEPKDVAFITARACASLDQLLSWSGHFMNDETICLFAKGKNYAKEIDDARESWAFDLTCHPSIIDSESVILQLKQIRKRRP